MAEQNKNILGIFILILVIIGIIFISGCVQSPETKQLAEKLSTFDKNLEISLANIHTDFYNYDIRYSASTIFSSVTITESMVSGMEKKENEIKEDLSNAESVISEYESLKQSADVDQLNENQKSLIDNIESKKSDFNSNKDKVNSCLENMKIFREFVDLGRLNILNLEEFSTKLDLINNEIESENYDDALKNIENFD